MSDKSLNRFNYSDMCTKPYDKVWSGSLDVSNVKDKKFKYVIHSTGDADMNGRKYVALPEDTRITSEIKRRYNLM